MCGADEVLLNLIDVIIIDKPVLCDVNKIHQDNYFKRDDFQMRTHIPSKGKACVLGFFRDFTIRNTLSNICCVGGKTCCVGGLPYTTHFQNMLCVITFYNRNVGCAYV